MENFESMGDLLNPKMDLKQFMMNAFREVAKTYTDDELLHRLLIKDLHFREVIEIEFFARHIN